MLGIATTSLLLLPAMNGAQNSNCVSTRMPSQGVPPRATKEERLRNAKIREIAFECMARRSVC